MSTFVTLHRFYNPLEAEFFKSQLEAEGIQSYLLDQNTNYSIGPILATGLRLQIKKEDWIKAKMILEKYLDTQE